MNILHYTLTSNALNICSSLTVTEING